jgi:hypothetical protein
VEMHSGTDSYLAWIARTLVVALSLFFFTCQCKYLN